MGNIRKETQFHICHMLFHNNFVLQTINRKQDINSRYYNQQNKQDIQEIGKRSFPKGRKHFNIKQAHVIRPYSIGIGGTYLKHIMPFGQVGIGGGTLLADIVPRFLKSLQNIGILYSGRFRIVKCGKTNRENIFLVRELQFTGIIQTLFQYIFFIQHNVFIGYKQFGKH